MPERADTKERIDSEEQASKMELIPSLDPCLPSASYSFSLVSVLL
ncbi:lysozyme, partial [Vibrio sp. 10N.222.48.A8]